MEEKEKVALTSNELEGRLNHNIINSITDNGKEINDFSDFLYAMQRTASRGYLNYTSLDEIMDTAYPPKIPIIEGLLHSGVYLFVGAPKVGKSFLMLQLAYHISKGIALWGYQIKQHDVIYLALEDDEQRIQQRAYRMLGVAEANGLHFAFSVPSLENGLEKALKGFLTEKPKTKVIIIDTLQKIRDSSECSYANDYQVISRLKQFADNHEVSIVIVHHTRKQKSDDNFEMISGTNGLLGAADGAFVLQKESRVSDKAMLDVSGRDIQDQRLYLARDEETLAWNLEKKETELWKATIDPVIEAIAEMITEDNPRWEGTATELVEKLGIDISTNIITKKLNANVSLLLNNCDIVYKYSRRKEGRKIALYRVSDDS
ncbi:MAG: AAA family ATPase [Oscillospiraceae bacterium]|nr:AAA family ATPase [Oscillospiraceae bacterium]